MNLNRKGRALVGALVLASATAALATPALGDSSPTTSTQLAAPSAFANNSGLAAHGLTGGGRLIRFDTERPGRAWSVGRIWGLTGDSSLIGIDVRVQDNKLYGVGDQGGVYTISRQSARATKVSQLTVPLSGESFGVDFNPAADRLRIVSDTGQNLRHDVNPGGTTTADGTLTIPPATTPATGVTAAAYTNNDLDANTVTTLFDLDTLNDQVAVQAPANAGLLSPTGKVGMDVSDDVGFDIYSRQRNGVTTSNKAFAVFTKGASSRLAKVSLLTGKAADQGGFPRGWSVVDIAIGLDQ
jgi:hypothetical protein